MASIGAIDDAGIPDGIRDSTIHAAEVNFTNVGIMEDKAEPLFVALGDFVDHVLST